MIGLLTSTVCFVSCKKEKNNDADNRNIQYVGRMDFTNPKCVKFSAAGAYIKAKFKGTYLEIIMNDCASNTHNYIEVVIDNMEPTRIQLTAGKKAYKIADNLSAGEHTVLICKDTEASIGLIEFYGFNCEGLL